MKKTALAAIALASSAFGYQPTQTDVQTALGKAAAAWGIEVDVQTIKLDRLNACRIGIDPAALSEFRTRTITINTACKWSKALLWVAVRHEYGHMIFGNAEHSKNRRSVMYAKLGQRRRITAEDRESAREEVQARLVRPTILRGATE